MTSFVTDPHPLPTASHRPPWSEPLPHDRCNFHHDRKAVVAYAGTPLCAACAAAMRRPTVPPPEVEYGLAA